MNIVQQKDGGYISFLENTKHLGFFFSGDDDGAGETAICTNGNYYILNGDFREEYKDKTIDECLEFFRANQDKKSQWSESLPVKENVL